MARRINLRALVCAALLLAPEFGLDVHPARAQVRHPVQRVSLLAWAESAQDEIRLADLLPAGVPVWLAELAPGIVLGRSPQPGSVRAFGQEQLARSLEGYPQVLAAISIPSRVEVRSSAREVTGEEIVASMVRSLEASHLRTEMPLDGGFLVRFPRVAVHSEAPGLEVTQLEESPGSGLLRFRMWTAAEPGVRPFWVETRARLAADSRAGSQALPTIFQSSAQPISGASARRGEAPAGIQPSKPATDAGAGRPTGPLVEPGEPATILIQGNGLRIQAAGIALERGWRGQRIRVRAVGTGKVLIARVVGERMLLALF